ncbi:hypothetical protein WJ96_05935 [Burkholderia ubonensis]|uniref:Topo IA-type catalytic domain-containing protein n=1 Tax=Burkholderia ubonensis TaxID=101571 RepID=A0AAW3MT75_9BURK|nr:DNA topoisomerase [Burkholderia ubonensis]KVP98109.1 hypothetical protein WJ96_05935 [Burkholderia ubonensis]KVZ92806.1 hypothetical protein WL25_17595 [Burkholderia ubonensis]
MCNSEPRLAHTLFSIQREAAVRFRYDPAATLADLHVLYERGLVSYPRTECGYLPDDQFKAAGKLVKALRGVVRVEGAQSFTVNHKFKGPAWNDARVYEHHGISPTPAGTLALVGLSDAQVNLYLLVCEAFLKLFEAPPS